MTGNTFIDGFLAACLAGMITGVGGLGIFLKKRYLKSQINQLLNIAAGVMLAASFFSLLVPSMNEIVRHGNDIYVSAFKYALAVFGGVVLIWTLNVLIPHEHNEMGHHGPHFDIKKSMVVCNSDYFA